MRIDSEPLPQNIIQSGAQRSIFIHERGISIPPSKYIDKSLMYKGKDGHDYPTSKALFEANRRWMEVNYPKITRDPRFI